MSEQSPAERQPALAAGCIDARDRFERQWLSGQRPRLEDFLARAQDAEREALLRELLGLELDHRARGGETPSAEEYRRRLPGHEAVIEGLFATVVLVAGNEPATPTTGEVTAQDLPQRAGRYRIASEVARGGMGVVLRAHDPDLERPLAVKVLLGKHKGNAQLERRFLEEAKITGQLQHPAIPPVHEVGRLDDGRPFFAMKLIRGHTLAELLRQRKGPADDLPRWLGVFASVCQGVGRGRSDHDRSRWGAGGLVTGRRCAGHARLHGPGAGAGGDRRPRRAQ
jgi:hypothetical protein